VSAGTALLPLNATAGHPVTVFLPDDSGDDGDDGHRGGPDDGPGNR
jgi:hypothetical protein